VSFRTQHSGKPIASPAILERIGTAFRRAVRSFAADSKIPVVRFINDDRKIERMRPYLARQAATGRAGVAPSGVAQECTRVFLATKHTGENQGVWSAFTKADRPGTSQSARCRPLTTVWDRPLVVSRVNGVDSALDEDHARVGIKKPELAPGLWPGLRLGRQGEAAAVPRFNIRAVRPVAGPEVGRRKCQPPPVRP